MLISSESDATLRLPRVSVCRLPRGGKRVVRNRAFAILNAEVYCTLQYTIATASSTNFADPENEDPFARRPNAQAVNPIPM
jgi:hypothetical protein